MTIWYSYPSPNAILPACLTPPFFPHHQTPSVLCPSNRPRRTLLPLPRPSLTINPRIQLIHQVRLVRPRRPWRRHTTRPSSRAPTSSHPRCPSKPSLLSPRAAAVQVRIHPRIHRVCDARRVRAVCPLGNRSSAHAAAGRARRSSALHHTRHGRRACPGPPTPRAHSGPGA